MPQTVDAKLLPSPRVLAEFADQLADSGAGVRESGAAVVDAWRPIASHYESPEALDLFVAMNPVETQTSDHSDVLAALGAVVDEFCERVRALERLTDEAQIGAGLGEAEDRAVAQINALALGCYRIPAGQPHSLLTLGGAAPWSRVLPSFDEGVESTSLGLLTALLRSSDVDGWADAHPRRIRRLLDSPPDASAVREWWSGLDRASRDALIAAVPLVIGNLDGIVLADRASANRLNIAAEIADLQRRNRALAALPGYDSHYRPVPGSEAYASSIEANNDLITSYRLLLDHPAALLLRGPEGNGRQANPPVIVAFDPARESFIHYLGFLDATTGELPATTTSVGILVPGTMTKPSIWQKDLFRAEHVLQMVPDTATTGIFTWAGGHFPQDADAALSHDSKILGPKLADFANALRPTTGASITGIGYSYGGAVLGMAENVGIQLDRSVSMAGAGLGSGVTSVDDYALTSDSPHYAMMAPGDHFVGHSQGLELGPLGHGASPLEPATGFIRLDTGHHFDAETGEPLEVVRGHSAIWARGSTPVRQLANLLIGAPVVPFASSRIIAVP
jgi:hypothetical protein